MNYNLPIDYTKLHWTERRQVREQYIKEQDWKKASIEDFLNKRIDSICGSYRHDFSFLTETYQNQFKSSAKEWIHAICKELE